MPRLLFMILVSLGLWVSAASAASVSRSTMLAVRDACKPDFETYCKGVSRGDGKLQACLADHHDAFSAPCQQALDSARQERK